MACHIRRDDMVEVISGDHKGRRGRVLKVMPDRGLVLIQGINMVFRHVRPSRKNMQGGRLEKEAPIQISNVLPIDEKAGRGRRIRFEVQRDDKGRVVSKQRVSVGGTRLNELTRQRTDG